MLPFVFVFFAFFWGAMRNPSLGCFLLVGCCLSCLGSFVAFFGGRCQIPRLGVSWAAPDEQETMPNPSLGCFLLVGCLLNGWSWISLSRIVWNKALLHPCMPYYPLRAMEHHFVVPKCPKSVKISPSSQVLPCLFWGRCQIPRLGVSCSSGAAFSVCFFLPFLGGDAKSLAWVFLARRVLPFVLGFFCCLFWGRCQI